MNENELNDILSSIKNGEEKKQYEEIKLPKIEKPKPKAESKKESGFALEELEPPKPLQKAEIEPKEIDAEKKTEDKIKKQKPEIIPKEQEKATPEIEPPKPASHDTEAENDLVWLDEKELEEKDKKEKKPAVSAQQMKENIKTQLIPNFTDSIKKLFTKAFLVKIGVVLLVVLAVFGSIKLVQHAKVAYLKPYEEKYKIAYPAGIKKDYCDLYGKNSSLAGVVEIEDTKTKEYVYSNPKNSQARFEKGSNINVSQHYRAAALSKDKCDLEKYYSTAKAFKKASQKIKFTTIFGDEEEYKVVAAFYTNTKAKDDNGYIFPYNLYGNITEKSFSAYQDRIKTRSLYYTGYEIQKDDYCFTVSVDSDIMPDFRFVVVAVKVDGRFKKSEKTTKNEHIRYPQAYCDKLGIHNMYHLASKWYPEVYTDKDNTKTKKLTIKDFEQ